MCLKRLQIMLYSNSVLFKLSVSFESAGPKPLVFIIHWLGQSFISGDSDCLRKYYR